MERDASAEVAPPDSRCPARAAARRERGHDLRPVAGEVEALEDVGPEGEGTEVVVTRWVDVRDCVSRAADQNARLARSAKGGLPRSRTECDNHESD